MIASLPLVASFGVVILTITPASALVALLCLSTLLAVVIVATLTSSPELAQDRRHRFLLVWLVGTVIWLIAGIGAALGAILVTEPLIWVLAYLRTDRSLRRWQGLALLYSMNALVVGVLAAYSFHRLLGGSLPLDQPTAYPDLLIGLLALAVGFATLIAARRAFVRHLRGAMPKLPWRWSAQAWLVPAPLILSLIYFNLGSAVFVAAVAAVCGHVITQHRLQYAQDDLAKRRAEQHTLQALSTLIHRGETIPAALALIEEQARQIVSFSAFFIAVCDEKHQRVHYPVAHVQAAPHEIAPQPFETSFVRAAIEQQRVITLSRHAAPHPIFDHFPQATQVALVPLVASDRCCGALGVLRYDDAAAYTPHELDALIGLAQQMGIMLHHAHLQAQNAQSARNFALINHSLQRVMFNTDIQIAFAATCEAALQLIEADKAIIYLYDWRDSERWEIVYNSGFDAAAMGAVLDAASPHLSLEDAALQHYHTRAEMPPHLRHFAKASQIEAMIQLPIQSGDVVLGYLGVYHTERYYHAATDVESLQLLTVQLAGGLDNAEALHILERFAAEQAQLVHLSRISGLDLNLERVIEEVCRLLGHMMNFAQVFILLQDHETHHLSLHTDAPTAPSAPDHLALEAIPEFNTLFAHPNRHRIDVYQRDTTRHSPALAHFMAHHHHATLVITALPRDEATMGLLLLADTQAHPLNDSQRRLLEVAKHQIAASIQNAQIHTFTEKALIDGLEQLALIEDMAQRVYSADSLEMIVDNLIDALVIASRANLVVIKFVAPDLAQYPVTWQSVVGEDVQHAHDATMTLTQLEREVLERRTMRRIHDEVTLAYLPNPTAAAYQAALLVPLDTGSRVLGLVILASQNANAFTEEQANFIRGLIRNASISVERIHLLNQLEQQITTLDQLRQLSLESAIATDLQTVQKTVLRSAITMLGGAAGLFFSSQYGELRREAQMTRDGGNEIAFEALFSLTDVETAFATHTTKIFEADAPDAPYQQAMLLPIRYANETRAVLCILYPQRIRLDDAAFNTLDLLAAQAANHLENALLTDTLHTQNKRMRVILDATQSGIIFLDQDGRVQDANAAASNYMGMDWKPNTTAHPDAPEQEPEQSWQTLLEAALQDPAILHQREFRLVQNDQERHLKTFVTPVHNADENPIGHLIILRDLTDEKALDKFRARLQDMTLHDLRSPLSAIISGLYMSQEYASKTPIPRQQLTDMLGITLHSAHNLLHLLDSLRDMPEMRKMLIQPVTSSLEELVRYAFQTLSAMFDAAQLRVQYAPTTADAVFVDRSLVHRILINLLNNAYNYTPTGGEIRVATRPAADARFIEVLVADTGPGIPPAMQHKIFEQFAQGDTQPTRDANKGMGLGLYFCKMAVEAHGGKIWVIQDGPLPGACVVFTLPRADQQSALM